MKKLLVLFILLFAVQISAQQPAAGSKKRPPVSAGSKSVIGKIKQFVEKEAGYTKVSEEIWLVPYKGKSLAQIDVMVTAAPGSELVVMAVVIAKQKELRLNQDFLYAILKYNNLADQVKAGIDEEGDLILRADISGRLMDLQEFKSVLEQVAAASDELHGQISSSLVSAP